MYIIYYYTHTDAYHIIASVILFNFYNNNFNAHIDYVKINISIFYKHDIRIKENNNALELAKEKKK